MSRPTLILLSTKGADKMTKTPASQERVQEDGTVRGYIITETSDVACWKVTPYTRRTLDGRRTIHHNDFNTFTDKVLAHTWGRMFRDAK